MRWIFTALFYLNYFGFCYKLTLVLCSCFYPLLKDRINGKAGDVIDIMALLATLFGIITTLGFGASQLGTCLYQMGWVSENSFSLQIIVIAVVTSLAVFFDQDEPAVELVIQKESMRDFM